MPSLPPLPAPVKLFHHFSLQLTDSDKDVLKASTMATTTAGTLEGSLAASTTDSFPPPGAAASYKQPVPLFDEASSAVISRYYSLASEHYLSLFTETQQLLSTLAALESSDGIDGTAPSSLSLHILHHRCLSLAHYVRLLDHLAARRRYTGIRLLYGKDGRMEGHYDNPVRVREGVRVGCDGGGGGSGEGAKLKYDWKRYKNNTLPETLYPAVTRQQMDALIPTTTKNEFLLTLNTHGSVNYVLTEAKEVHLISEGNVVVMDANNTFHGVESAGAERVGFVVWEGKEEKRGGRRGRDGEEEGDEEDGEEDEEEDFELGLFGD
jgi:hypothetical protein